MRALLIGGTGPTGPHIIRGLLERGYDVTMLNRGSRDSAVIPAGVERLRGDPHFPDTLEMAFGERYFDLAVATYGRIRYVAEVLSTRTDRLITVGGTPSYRGFSDADQNFPAGMFVPTREEDARVQRQEEGKFGFLVKTTEDAVMNQHAEGHMNVTHFRYPVVYGPWQLRTVIFEWVMQRCRDRRPHAVLPDGGLTLLTRGFSENMAKAVLLAADNPAASAGKIYNCGDERQFTLAQWVEIISTEMDWPLDIVTVPDAYASPARELITFYGSSHHQLLDLDRIKRDLGYKDVVDPMEAIQRTVRWLIDNPTEPNKLAEIARFYEIEDHLVEIYKNASFAAAALDHEESDYHHAYAHPRERNLMRDHRNR
ncbi:MAG: NAD-dependent epimerase/dehydratase family protein [Pseudomonadota bacterium]|nr:NAD-dependent epimerase/dehydratase family protein [Pseudomonadota bacterium]